MPDFDAEALVRDYGDIEAEAAACRASCALFDFSFLSRVELHGPGACRAIGTLSRRAMTDLPAGRIRYALRSDPEGRLLSDLTVWHLGGGGWEVMSGRGGDAVDLAAATPPGTLCKVASDDTAILAVQGPRSLAVLDDLTDIRRLAGLDYYAHDRFRVAGVDCRIGRLGYTGERGFELILPRRDRDALWGALVRNGARPAGFAAADCLRIEAGFVLFANEFRLPVTAAAVGLARFDAPGDSAAREKLVCFRAESARPPVLWRPPARATLPRAGDHITVTSACHSPLAGGVLGLGYVVAQRAGLGRRFTDPGGTFRNLRIVRRPFYDPAKRRPRGPWP